MIKDNTIMCKRCGDTGYDLKTDWVCNTCKGRCLWGNSIELSPGNFSEKPDTRQR